MSLKEGQDRDLNLLSTELQAKSEGGNVQLG